MYEVVERESGEGDKVREIDSDKGGKRASVEDGWNVHIQWTLSSLLLVLGDWYRHISRHWNILISTRFSNFASLVSSDFSLHINAGQSGVKAAFRGVWRLEHILLVFFGLLGCLSPGWKLSYMVYIISRTPTLSSWSHVSPTRCVCTSPLSSMPPSKFSEHSCRWNTCVMYTLGNRSIFCYTTPAIYAACQKASTSWYSTNAL